jgi:predicted transcriptional regulator
MTTTTSLKLPEALKEQIAQAAAREGKTAHALMVETLQSAMDDARMREEFHREAQEAHEDMLRTNICYSHEEISKWMRAKVRGDNKARPNPEAYDPGKPMRPELQPALHPTPKANA